MQCVSDGTRNSVSGAPKAFRRTYGILLHTMLALFASENITMCCQVCGCALPVQLCRYARWSAYVLTPRAGGMKVS
jgi:hypothetical protein